MFGMLYLLIFAIIFGVLSLISKSVKTELGKRIYWASMICLAVLAINFYKFTPSYNYYLERCEAKREFFHKTIPVDYIYLNERDCSYGLRLMKLNEYKGFDCLKDELYFDDTKGEFVKRESLFRYTLKPSSDSSKLDNYIVNRLDRPEAEYVIDHSKSGKVINDLFYYEANLYYEEEPIYQAVNYRYFQYGNGALTKLLTGGSSGSATSKLCDRSFYISDEDLAKIFVPKENERAKNKE